MFYRSEKVNILSFSTEKEVKNRKDNSHEETILDKYSFCYCCIVVLRTR